MCIAQAANEATESISWKISVKELGAGCALLKSLSQTAFLLLLNTLLPTISSDYGWLLAL